MVTLVEFPYQLAQDQFGDQADRVYDQLWSDPAYTLTPNYLQTLQSLLDQPQIGEVFQGAQFEGTSRGLAVWDGSGLIRVEENLTFPFPLTAPDKIRVDAFVDQSERNWWHNTWYRSESLMNLNWNTEDRIAQTWVVISEPDLTPGVRVTFSFEPSLGLSSMKGLEYFRSYLQSADFFIVEVDPNMKPGPGKVYRSIPGAYRVCADARTGRNCEELHLFCPSEREKYLRDPMSRRDLQNIGVNMVYESYGFPKMFSINWKSRVEQRLIRRSDKYSPLEFAATHGWTELVQRLEKSLERYPDLRPEIEAAVQETLMAESIRDALE